LSLLFGACLIVWSAMAVRGIANLAATHFQADDVYPLIGYAFGPFAIVGAIVLARDREELRLMPDRHWKLVLGAGIMATLLGVVLLVET
jgi:hypothetical protein